MNSPDLDVNLAIHVKHTPTGALSLKHTFHIANAKTHALLPTEAYEQLIISFLAQFGHILASKEREDSFEADG